MLRLICLAAIAVPTLVALSPAAGAQDTPAGEPFPVVGYERDVTNLVGE